MFSISCSFGKIIGWRPLPGGLALPPTGNPGSAQPLNSLLLLVTFANFTFFISRFKVSEMLESTDIIICRKELLMFLQGVLVHIALLELETGPLPLLRGDSL